MKPIHIATLMERPFEACLQGNVPGYSQLGFG